MRLPYALRDRVIRLQLALESPGEPDAGRREPDLAEDPESALHPYAWERADPALRAVFSEAIDREEKLFFMKMAIDEARKSPFHPTVGAVIARDGEIMATGHRDSVWVNGSGPEAQVRLRHAEEAALTNAAGRSLAGATLYTTLEPCYGRWTQGAMARSMTCSTAIVRSGITTVVVGLIDRDVRTRGRGVRYMAKHGVRVEHIYDGIEQDLYDLIGSGKFWHAAPERRGGGVE